MAKITEADREASRRLYAIWQQQKKETGLTQTQLAKQIGLTNEQLSHLMHGRRRLTLGLVMRLANELDVKATEIRDDIEELKSTTFGLIDLAQFQQAANLVESRLDEEGIELMDEIEKRIIVHVYNEIVKGQDVTQDYLNNIIKYEASLDTA